uniref:Uncharacterized protein n=1 Tax=Tetranychus urticae TaxID=32264 RepID=T1KQI9_TETUR
MGELKEAIGNIAQTGHAVNYLKFRKNSLTIFPAFLLDGLDVTHLIAHHCNISSIEETAFIEKLTFLVSLHLNYNNIQVLHYGAFRGLISLLRLSLYGNKIKTIDPNVFHGIGGNLTRINLGANQLTSIDSSSFFNLTTLKRLQLHENRITSIDVNTFKGFSASDSLDALNLASNNIKEIPEKSFQSLSSLNSLALEKNRISAIHPFAFQGIEDSLEWLTLGDNILNSIPSYALQNLTRLRQLDLRGNNITIVEENSFKDFGLLKSFLFILHILFRLDLRQLMNVDSERLDKNPSHSQLFLKSRFIEFRHMKTETEKLMTG